MCGNYKFEIGDVVTLKDNYLELWKEYCRMLPKEDVIKHYNSMISEKLTIKNRCCWNENENLYNIDGFCFEEYILEKCN